MLSWDKASVTLLTACRPGPQLAESRTVNAKATCVVELSAVTGASTMVLFPEAVLSANTRATATVPLDVAVVV